MTIEENQLIDSLGDMDDSQIISLSKEALCMNIKQLLVIIAKLDFPVGPERVLRVEDSLPQDPICVTETKKGVGRSHDRLV